MLRPSAILLALSFAISRAFALAADSRYPIGIYSVPLSADFAEIRAAGFNVVVGRAERDYLDAARAVHVYGPLKQ